MTEYTAWVRCGGRLHAISLKNGAIVLHDHPSLLEERAMVALGALPPKCLQVLEAWRRRDIQKVPDALKPALREATGRSLARAVEKQRRDPLARPLWDRIAERTRPIAEKVLGEARYRRSQTGWAGGKHVCLVHVGQDKPGIYGWSERVWSSNGKWRGTNSGVTAVVPLTWLVRVHKAGIALVDGVFVLDVLAKDEKGWTVLAGRQRAGFKVEPWQARVTRGKDRTYRLHWSAVGE